MCDLWRISVITAIPLTVCCLLTVTVGYSIFGEFIPNGHRVPDPCRKDKVWKPVGHQGFHKRSPLNAFGVDFAKSRSWDKHLCELDSDGDGRTNGEELGDPNCTWTSDHKTSSNTTKITYSLSHPGICEPLNSSDCLSRNLWLNGCRPFTCPALNAADVHSIRLRLPQEVTLPPAATDPTGGLGSPWLTPGRRTICMKMALPSAEKDYHVIGSQPVLNPSLLLHVEDIALYACEADPARVSNDMQFDCDVYPRDLGTKLGCYSLIAAWSWNGPAGECHPELYGFRIGRRTYRSAILRVQMISDRASETKVSGAGLVIFYTDRLRPNDAGTLVIEASPSPLALAGPMVSRQGKCLRPKENRNCTGGYSTTINIAQAVIVTDNFDGARITVDVKKKSGSIQKLLDWRDFWDPNSYSSIHLPEFEPEDVLVLNCVTHSSALFCLSRITYYPAISRLGHCDGTPPADVIPSATCPLPGVGSACRIGFLLQQSTDTFSGCPWKPDACLKICEMVVDTVHKSGCGSRDLEVQSRSFSQLLRYVDFMQSCPPSTGVPRTFRVQRTTTVLPPLPRIPGDSHEPDLYRKRSRGSVDMDAMNRVQSVGASSSKSTPSSKTFATQSVAKFSWSSTAVGKITLNAKRGSVELRPTTKPVSTDKSDGPSTWSNNVSNSSRPTLHFTRDPVESHPSTMSVNRTRVSTGDYEPSATVPTTHWSSVAAKRGPLELHPTTKSASTDQSVGPSAWRNNVKNSSTLHFTWDRVELRPSTMSVDRTRVSTGDSEPSAKVSTTPWSSVGLDEVSEEGVVDVNVDKTLSAAAKATVNIFAVWTLLGLLCVRYVMDGFHLWDQI